MLHDPRFTTHDLKPDTVVLPSLCLACTSGPFRVQTQGRCLFFYLLAASCWLSPNKRREGQFRLTRTPRPRLILMPINVSINIST